MPLTLLDFSVTENDGKCKLSWVTASEDNVDRFEIEKSLDGASFEKIGTVAAKGENSLINTTYHFSDGEAPAKLQYYRLKMIDRDGQYTYSPVQRVSSAAKSEGTWLYPNPVQGGHITIQFTQLPWGGTSYNLMNSLGHSVQKGLLRNRTQALNIEGLAKGIYLLQLGTGDVLKFQKD